MLKMLQKRFEQHHLLQSLRLIFSGGAPLAPELRKRVLAIFANPPRIVQVWGMTEGGWFTTFKFPEDDCTGSVGRVISGLEIKMNTGNQLELGRVQAGELLVRGPQVMVGYFGNEQASKAAFEGDWLRTGDVGYINDGKAYLIDRSKDLIKVNGWQVSPAEIEATVLDLPGIEDAAAIAAGHGVQEHPLLFIVSSHQEDVSKEAVTNHLGRRLAKHKISKIVVESIKTIPRNASGKILRRMLREEAIQRGLMHGIE